MITKITIPADTEADMLTVVPLQDAKDQCKVDHDYENTLITSYIKAAFYRAQNYISAQILKKDVVIELNEWFTELQLPVGPVNSITSVTYLDAAGDPQTLAAENYNLVVVNGLGTLTFTGSEYPDLKENDNLVVVDNAVTITVNVGTDKAQVKEDTKIALLLMIAQLYEYRGNLPFNFADTAAASFLRSQRVYG